MSNNEKLLLILGVGFLFVIFFVKKKAVTGQIGLAGGAIAVPPASQTASNIDAVLAGASATLPSILGSFKNIFGSPTPPAGTGSSNVADSNTGAGPDTSDLESYDIDYSGTDDGGDAAWDEDESLEGAYA
jgi:hypothetical protein